MTAAALTCQAHRLNQRARRRVSARRANRETERLALAEAASKIQAPSFIARLNPDAEVVEVDTLGLTPSVLQGYGSADAYPHLAALASHLGSDAAYGPTVRRAVRVEAPGQAPQDLILVGRLSAVERTVPDRETRLAWAEAGVMVSGPGVPIVRQMEVR